MGHERGRLILIEGLDRTGKSTQASLLALELTNAKVIKFPERSTKIGAVIDEYLTNEDFNLSDQSAHLLFLANRWEVAENMTKELNNGVSLVVDRYIYSGIAYSLAKLEFYHKDSQSEMSKVDWLYAPDRGLPKPDMTLFLTLDLTELGNRKGWGEERYEKEEFQKIVKKCFFLTLKWEEDDTVIILDVQGKGIDEVKQMIWDIVAKKLMNTLTNEPLHKFM
ncbi:uncharacterized protein PRCAT00005755001 [Priceomyces carsonii]|uniref:uncharacterized protein n=1 Tax=Priceomyces carsonii TaxID=28549 RepID=UPI002ED83557|nr:unnamed protein product [Priceomyces carsonii]